MLDNQHTIIKRLKEKGSYTAALKKIQDLINKNPDEYDLYFQASEIAILAKKIELAERFLISCLKQDSKNLDTIINYGNFLLFHTKNYNKAYSFLEKAHAIKSDSLETNFYFGRVSFFLGKLENAIVLLEQARKIDKENYHVEYLLSLVFLKIGKSEIGWKLYRSRHKILGNASLPWGHIRHSELQYSSKWNGEDLTNKHILVMPEQGFGDFIMCYRYVYVLKNKYKCQVTALCQNELLSLISTNNVCDFLHSTIDKNFKVDAQYDYWTTIFDLPSWLFMEEKLLPKFPYLGNLNLKSDQGLFMNKNKKIGLVWKGNSNHYNDKNRSINDIDALVDLTKNQKLAFYSFQLDSSGSKNNSLYKHLTDLEPYIKDFSDTAFFLNKIDLLISVDTGIVHLAGSMNIPCWLILPYYDSDWRWSEKSEKTPWYPSVKIFRNHSEDWSKILGRVSQELANF